MRCGVAIVLVAAVATHARAEGRAPATSTLDFQQGSPQHLAAGTTFGLLVSDDGGLVWHWYCETAVGYGGTYDPDYAYSSSGAVFATTFDGIKVMRDGCMFASTPAGTTYVSTEQLGADGALYIAVADPTDAKIYKSTNDGASFPTSASPGANNDWWDSLIVAPSNPQVSYLSGYRIKNVCTGGASAGNDCISDLDCPGSTCEVKKFFLLFGSTNGGTSFTPLAQSGLTLGPNSTASFVGVNPSDANTVYLHVSLETTTAGDGIYKSTDGGATWNKILFETDPYGLVFLVRFDNTLVAATQTSGAVTSANGAGCTSIGGCAWTSLPSPPHINCLAEHPTTHDVWACTRNYDAPGVPGDGFGIMKSGDLATWNGVLRYQDIAGPAVCGAGTVQHDQCGTVWCCLEQQLGITSAFDCSGPRACPVAPDGSPDDVPVGRDTTPPPSHVTVYACCSGADGTSGMVLGVATLALLLRRRQPS